MPDRHHRPGCCAANEQADLHADVAARGSEETKRGEGGSLISDCGSWWLVGCGQGIVRLLCLDYGTDAEVL